MRKTILAASAVGIMGLASVAGAGLVSAASKPSSHQANLIDALAAKFHLNKADVQQVFATQHASNQAVAAARFKTKLDAAVASGALTQTQENTILAHQTSEQAFSASLAGMSQADRKAAITAHAAADKVWAAANNFPAQYAGRGRRRGRWHYATTSN